MFCGALVAPFVAPAARAQRRQAPAVRPDSAARRRPTPGAVIVPPAFARAIANGTRTSTGEPGPRNWVQHAAYSIDAAIDPTTNTLTGTERVTYTNNSPDTLPRRARAGTSRRSRMASPSRALSRMVPRSVNYPRAMRGPRRAARATRWTAR